MTNRRFAAIAALGLAFAAACHDDELFTAPAPGYKGGGMFVRYVAMGNSITAGFQSGGINDSTQTLSYTRIVATEAMGSPYYYPSLTMPGCPPPFTNVFTGARVAGGTGTTCLYRSSATPPFLTNVAVPGAEVYDLLVNGPAPGTSSNALTQLFLGGRTQTEAMVDSRPTFVSVWIGNNDILGAAFASDIALITDSATFATRYKKVLDSVQAVGAKALLIGVGLGTLPQTVLPYWSRGSTYYGLYLSGAFAPAPFTVTANCAPTHGDSVLVPFPFGLGLINTAKGGTPTMLDCTESQTVQPAELAKLDSAQAAYNSFIQAEAAARSWAYLQLNTTFDSLRTVTPAGSQIAPFPNTSADCSGSPFGLAFSCDGIHPSTVNHRLIAKKVVQAINATYGSAIPAVP